MERKKLHTNRKKQKTEEGSNRNPKIRGKTKEENIWKYVMYTNLEINIHYKRRNKRITEDRIKNERCSNMERNIH